MSIRRARRTFLRVPWLEVGVPPPVSGARGVSRPGRASSTSPAAHERHSPARRVDGGRAGNNKQVRIRGGNRKRMDSLIPFRYPAPARITPLPKATVKKPLPEPQSASLLPATWTHRHSMLALGGVTLACLLPFTAKAFNIDDPLFLWTAQQITHHPADPYGFDLVWYTIQMHMWAVTKNPPLASYYAALIGSFAGFSERAMHLAFLVPALALIAGTYQLARHFTTHPIVAATATLFAPAVMVSATSVMCDTMMLALWVWAALFWIQGLERHRPLYLLSSSLLLAAAALTKYFGASLIPLLIVYSIVRLRRPEKSLLYLLIPTAALIAYQWWTQDLYGQGLLSDAVSYASNEGKDWSGIVGQTLIGLSFLGGCTLPALVFAPILWSRKALAALFSADTAMPTPSFLPSGSPALSSSPPLSTGPSMPAPSSLSFPLPPSSSRAVSSMHTSPAPASPCRWPFVPSCLYGLPGETPASPTPPARLPA